MTLVPFLCLIFIISVTSKEAKAFHCFLCHQTSKECNNGVKLNLHVTNCSTNSCFVLKYETEMPGVTVLATFRGCYLQPEYEILSTVVTEKHKVVPRQFHICNDTLCNRGVDNRLDITIYVLILVQIILSIVNFSGIK